MPPPSAWNSDKASRRSAGRSTWQSTVLHTPHALHRALLKAHLTGRSTMCPTGRSIWCSTGHCMVHHKVPHRAARRHMTADRLAEHTAPHSSDSVTTGRLTTPLTEVCLHRPTAAGPERPAVVIAGGRHDSPPWLNRPGSRTHAIRLFSQKPFRKSHRRHSPSLT